MFDNFFHSSHCFLGAVNLSILLTAFHKRACNNRRYHSNFTMDFIRDVADNRWLKDVMAVRNSGMKN